MEKKSKAKAKTSAKDNGMTIEKKQKNILMIFTR